MSDYGERIGRAFDAIRLLYSDVSRLFSELDEREFRDWISVFGSEVYKRGSKDLKTKGWMPPAVVRFYRKPELEPGLKPQSGSDRNIVEGITCQFFAEKMAIPEPILVASRIKYRLPATQLRAENESDGWKSWSKHAWMDGRWQFPTQPLIDRPSDQDVIEWAVTKAIWTFDINSREQIHQLIDEVRQAAV